jgi:hypothetical protein
MDMDDCNIHFGGSFWWPSNFHGQGEERIQIARSTVKSIFWMSISWVLDWIVSFFKLLDVLPDLFK